MKPKKVPVTAAPEWCVEVILPVVVKSVSNLHEQPFVRHRRVKAERLAVSNGLRVLMGSTPPSVPFGYAHLITLTRLGGKGLDGDNVQSAFKAVRDEVAAWLRLPDDKESDVLDWKYGQEPGGPRGIRISIRCYLP